MQPRTLHRVPFLLSSLLAAAPAATQVDPAGRSILFVRGADGSGGGAGVSNPQQRTEVLSDVFDDSTAPGNSGFGELRRLLLADGFAVSQLIESPAPLTLPQLTPHRVVVLGSNNRSYAAAEVQAFHAYIDAGGSALVISDAQWGPLWGTAAIRDNQFLARYGVQVYQDNGFVLAPSRSEAGRFLIADHPLLAGPAGIGGGDDVGTFEGEGVSLFQIGQGSAGYQAVATVSAMGYLVRLHTPGGSIGGTQPAAAGDAAAFVVERGQTRIAGHFDRNTFFNLNGAGSDLHRFDNAQLARNLFRWLASVPAAATPVGSGCGIAAPPALSATPPVLGGSCALTLANGSPGAPASLLLGLGPAQPLPLGACTLQVPLPGAVALAAGTVGAGGSWQFLLPVPDAFALTGLPVVLQLALSEPGGPLAGAFALSNGVQLQLGYPR